MAWPARLLVILSLMIVSSSQKVQETRTALHVARSLDPSTMEEMQVKTRTGEVATLLVKKRDGRHNYPVVKEGGKPEESKTNSSESSKETDTRPPLVPNPVVISSEPIHTKDEDIKTIDQTNRTAKNNDLTIPSPVYIRSSSVSVKGKQNNGWNSRARSLMTVDHDGIPVIEGVRMPDDESDKVVWRNARVIDGKLTPYDKTQSKHTFDVKPTEKKKPGSQTTGQWVKLDPVKPISEKESLTSYKAPWSSVPILQPPTQDKFKPSELIDVVPTTSGQDWHEVHRPQQVVQIIGEARPLPESEHFIRDRILDYIKRINRDELVKRQYSERESRSFKDSSEQPQIQARVLQSPGASVYPTSLLYSPPSQQPSRVSFEEGVRTPVLQYAHPELGVQPAKVITNPEPEVTESSKLFDRREQALAYFAHDIHADRSPYAFEPGLEDEARVEDFSNNGKRSHSGVSQRPKKTLPYFYADQAVTDSYKDKYYGKYSYNPNSYPSYGAYQKVDARPFWQRMTDSIKEHVQTSMDTVSDLTRPVMEPLVEASHKISKNLGLESSGYRELSTLKEKLGTVGSPSVILPALGLVAGGAALGLGAVAVGRYLDVDMLKRSKGDDDLILDDNLSAEHKRAMESIARSLIEDPGSPVVGELTNSQEAQAKEAIEVVKAVEEAEAKAKEAKKKEVESISRRRRSVDPDEALESMIQSLDVQRHSEGVMPTHAVWSTTPCAKKVFCEVMSLQNDDSILLTEKKMATYMQMVHPSMADSVGFHLSDVMAAVRAKDCSGFSCPRHIAEYPGPR